MEIMDVILTLQRYSEEMLTYKLDAEFAAAVEAAVNLLEAQGERITDLENELQDERYRHDRLQDFEVAEAEELRKAREQLRWIPVTERLPENEVDVLILTERRLYGIAELDRKTVRIVATAFHTDGKMNTEDSSYNWDSNNLDMEYWEEADVFIVPEGWWEAVRYGEDFSAVDDHVTHWMPLPEAPKGDVSDANS